jgi:hypothetical protein
LEPEAALIASTETDVWAPQPGPQSAFVACQFEEVFYGGARAGGKTDAVLGKWALKEGVYGANFNAIMFRRTTVSAEDAIERSRQIYRPLGADFNEAKLLWRMPHGGRISFRYLETVTDAAEYQGRNLTDAWVEEAGQYPDPAPIDRLFGVLRSSAAVPIQLVLTGNPGGPGQHWLAQRYNLIPFPRAPQLVKRKTGSGKMHVMAVIPARIQDNLILQARDPDYIHRLHMVGSPQLVKAWLEGDFSAVEGAYFDCWSDAKHVIEPFAIPESWVRFRSMDWGSNSPFSVGWWAVVQDDYSLGNDAGTNRSRNEQLGGTCRTIPRGAIVRYREWYGAKGAKLTNERLAQGIIERECFDPKLADAVLDPRCFAVEGGPSIAEQINNQLSAKGMTHFRQADNRRVPPRGSPETRGPLSGWAEMRQRLVGKNEIPMIYCFSTCKDSIRTIPKLQHDPKKAEDVDTNSEDHAADEWRYACMSRPWLRSPIVKEDFEFKDYHTSQRQYDETHTSFMTL